MWQCRHDVHACIQSIVQIRQTAVQRLPCLDIYCQSCSPVLKFNVIRSSNDWKLSRMEGHLFGIHLSNENDLISNIFCHVTTINSYLSKKIAIYFYCKGYVKFMLYYSLWSKMGASWPWTLVVCQTEKGQIMYLTCTSSSFIMCVLGKLYWKLTWPIANTVPLLLTD